jgi:hypothetical protein
MTNLSAGIKSPSHSGTMRSHFNMVANVEAGRTGGTEEGVVAGLRSAWADFHADEEADLRLHQQAYSDAHGDNRPLQFTCQPQ